MEDTDRGHSGGKDRVFFLYLPFFGPRAKTYGNPVWNYLMAEMRDGTCSDVTIKVEWKLFQMHRLYLSSISPYFKAMFNNDFKENITRVVELKEMEAATFQLIYDFLMDDFEVTVSSFESLKALICAAHLLHITPLLDALDQTFSVDLNSLGLEADSIFQIWQMATTLSLKQIEDRSQRILVENIDKFKGTGIFSRMNWEQMKTLISDKRLNLQQRCHVDKTLKMDRERNVFDIVMEWFAYVPKERYRYVMELFPYVRVNKSVLKIWIRKTAKDYPKTDLANSLVKLLRGKKMSMLTPVRADRERELLVSRTSTKEIIGVELSCFKKYHITNLPAGWFMYESIAMGNYDGDIYVAGGNCLFIDPEASLNGETDRVSCFSNTTGKWNEIGPTATSKSSLKLLVCGGKLYATGITRFPIPEHIIPPENNQPSIEIAVNRGQLFITIDEYDKVEDKWIEVYLNGEDCRQTDILESIVFKDMIVILIKRKTTNGNWGFMGYLFNPKTKECGFIETGDGLEKDEELHWQFDSFYELVTEGDYIYIVTDNLKVFRFYLDLRCGVSEVMAEYPVCISAAHDIKWYGKQRFVVEVQDNMLRILDGHVYPASDEIIQRYGDDDTRVCEFCTTHIDLRTGATDRTVSRSITTHFVTSGSDWKRMWVKEKWLNPIAEEHVPSIAEVQRITLTNID